MQEHGCGPHRAAALRICLYYIAAAVAWIVFSDLLLVRYAARLETMAYAGLAKGVLFVLVTGALLCTLLLRRARAIEQREREIVAARERLDFATAGAGLGVWEWREGPDAERVMCSARAAELIGLPAGNSAAPAETFIARVHPDDRTAVTAAVRAALRDGGDFGIEFRIKRPEGGWRWLRSRARAARSAPGGTMGVFGVIEDIDERKRAEQALAQSEARLRAVLEQSFSALFVIQDGRVVYVNPRTRAIFGHDAEEPFDPDPLAHVEPAERERLSGLIERWMRGESTGAVTVAALRKDGTRFTLGAHPVLGSYSGRPALIVVAQDVTEKVRAEEEIRRYVERLEQTMRGTIGVITTIGELRDPYTHGHERRVGELAAAMAAEMGLDGHRVEGMRIGGYLHDVGKIGVPAEILAKPGRLSQPEFELIKEHAQKSYEILRNVPFPWPIAQAAWQHHERLDGSGYPRGLRGDEISLEARILAVADTVEAMASHRPYRPALGIEAALAEIEKNRGITYDADAVDACLRLFRSKGYVLSP
jgi:PAS domain S-box-containing protein/putative nucleotidyltransferase with HDIG domain